MTSSIVLLVGKTGCFETSDLSSSRWEESLGLQLLSSSLLAYVAIEGDIVLCFTRRELTPFD